jgi:hypothetical protein
MDCKIKFIQEISVIIYIFKLYLFMIIALNLYKELKFIFWDLKYNLYYDDFCFCFYLFFPFQQF